jgi:hypothetical protein
LLKTFVIRIQLCAVLPMLALAVCAAISLSAAPPQANAESTLKVGAVAVDITPLQFPVIVNGMFEERTADRAVDRLFARAFVLDDGGMRIAIVVVDSCMLPRELLDDAKLRAFRLTGIPVENMLISATHTHSAPSSMGCLGSRADPDYPTFLEPQLARAIELANERRQPAQIGFAKVHAPNHTFCRRYIRRPDRVLNDPFGKPTVRANMNPGFLSPDVIGPSGPVDDELSVLAMQSLDGNPLGVLANFSMHYVGSPLLSSDYFGRFAQHLAKRIDGSDGSTACIVAMSQGTSGDLISQNQSRPKANVEYDHYAEELADIADAAYRKLQYQKTAPLAMRETKLTLNRRLPDAERLAWAKSMAAKIGDRRPKGWPEIYALEQIMLDTEPQRELKLQALRIGDIAIAAMPNEVFAITGLKLKLQSPLPNTFNIELANGADGYIPPPEQHKLGGYTTWAARTAGLEVDAEPKIVETLLKLLEEVTGKPRRALPESGGAYAEAVLKSRPRAYWRLGEIGGNVAADSSGNHNDAHYEDGISRYLDGPNGSGFDNDGHSSHAAHFAGGRVRAGVPNIGGDYSVEFWFWNGLPNDARADTGYLFSRGPDSGAENVGDQLGIGGTRAALGRLIFSDGNSQSPALEGRATIEPWTWNHVMLVRDDDTIRVHLNGSAQPEINGKMSVPQAAGNEWFFGGRGDNVANLEGKLSEVAIYDRALSADEVKRHYEAAGVPNKGTLTKP